MNLEEITFCGHMNEDVCDLSRVIEGKGRVEFEFKKAEGEG